MLLVCDTNRCEWDKLWIATNERLISSVRILQSKKKDILQKFSYTILLKYIEILSLIMKYGVGEKKASFPTVGKRDCEREKK